MPSHLTRHVFRRLLADEPVLYRGCLRRQSHMGPTTFYASTPRQSNVHRGSGYIVRPQQRTFFNINLLRPGKRDSQEADVDPGIDKMMEYAKRARMKARLPPLEDMVEAVEVFLRAKKRSQQGITDTQAQLLLQSLKYCMQTARSGEGSAKPLYDALSEAAPSVFENTVRLETQQLSAAHLELLITVHDALKNLPDSMHLRLRIMVSYVVILRKFGQPLEARAVALQFDSLLNSADAQVKKDLASIWVNVLRTFSMRTDEHELLHTLEMLKERGLNFPVSTSAAMLEFYVGHDQADPVKRYFTDFWREASNHAASPVHMSRSIHKVLQWCLAKDYTDFGHQVVREITSTNPPKAVWDVILIWAAGSGKGADEIDRMMSVMESLNESIPNTADWRVPDITTINRLVQYAIAKDDPYLAERFIATGKTRQIQPDAWTYALQMEYRLRIKDIDGALIAYKNLQAMDLSTQQDVPTVNKLIIALCHSKRHDFDTIMNVAADLSDRRALFEPDTVATLGLLHLSRDEVHDVIDLLNTHVHHFSSSERSSVCQTFVTYCTDSTTPIARSWDAYTVLRSTFDEMPREQRTSIMLSFFRRDRPDMAVHVFNNMRSHTRPDTIPTVDTYVAAFMATARLRDLDVLEIIHNQLKIDYNIDPTTHVYNALMIAYTSCDQPRFALDFWDHIVSSREGPTYNSIRIALRACEEAAFGDLAAWQIWAELRKRNVELDAPLWASYVAALAGNGSTEEAIRTVEEAVGKAALDVDAFLVGSLFAGVSDQAKQADVESWCRDRYPHVWDELVSGGVEKGETGMRTFTAVDRSLLP